VILAKTLIAKLTVSAAAKCSADQNQIKSVASLPQVQLVVNVQRNLPSSLRRRWNRGSGNRRRKKSIESEGFNKCVSDYIDWKSRYDTRMFRAPWGNWLKRYCCTKVGEERLRGVFDSDAWRTTCALVPCGHQRFCPSCVDHVLWNVLLEYLPQTRLSSNLTPTNRECVHLVTRSHFWSRDKDGGHTSRSAIAKNPMLHVNFAYPCFIEPELLPIEVLHCVNRVSTIFCSCDVDLDPMTFIYELHPYSWRYTGFANMNFLRQWLRKLSSDRQTRPKLCRPTTPLSGWSKLHVTQRNTKLRRNSIYTRD